MVVDAKQTEAVTALCIESNPIVGRCGERLSPTVYFPAVAVAHAVISMSIPVGTWRSVWQAFSFGVAAKAVHSNYLMGIDIEW